MSQMLCLPWLCGCTCVCESSGLPSGGDWALQHSGAVTLRGTENVELTDCELTRLDGLGVLLSGFNRNTTLSHNVFSWIGDSAMAAVGETSPQLNANGTKRLAGGVPFGPDGRGGLQVRLRADQIRFIDLFLSVLICLRQLPVGVDKWTFEVASFP
eukprot:COSAG05_NODE_1380_length_5022_cov_25.282348_5_plen_156_part_00